MLTSDELERIDDISGSALLSAEVKRIPFLDDGELAAVTEAARQGDEVAQHGLIINCLNWTMTKAASIYQERRPLHSDVMDLIGHAHIKMLEALPNALKCDSPMKYLLSVSAREMWLYCTYDDPMVMRPKDRPLATTAVPATVSIEASPEIQVASPEVPWEADYQLVYEALGKLTEKRRLVLAASYGLLGMPAYQNREIAALLGTTTGTVESYLQRAKRSLAKELNSTMYS